MADLNQGATADDGLLNGHPASEMVEWVACAIDKEFSLLKNPVWGDADERRKNLCRMMARVAIAAMREPSEAVLDELDIANCGWGLREHSKELWESLIDEALK